MLQVVRIRNPIIGTIQQPIQPDPQTPKRFRFAAGTESDLPPECQHLGGTATAFHAAADPRPVRQSPSIILGETFIPPEGQSITSRNRYGVSPLPARPVQVLGDGAQPWPGAVIQRFPIIGPTMRDITSRAVATGEDTPPPAGRAVYSSMAVERSRPGVRTTVAAGEDPQPFPGGAIYSHAAVKNAFATIRPVVVSAEMPPMDGMVATAWHAPALMRMPGRAVVAAIPFTFPDSTAPLASHGTPPRDALTRLRLTPPAETDPPAPGTAIATHAAFGAFPTPAKPVQAIGEAAPPDVQQPYVRAARSTHVRTTRSLTITSGEQFVPFSGEVWTSRNLARPTAPAPRPTVAYDASCTPWLAPVTLTTFVPRTPYVAPLIGIIVYLTGADRSITSIDPDACCGDCE